MATARRLRRATSTGQSAKMARTYVVYKIGDPDFSEMSITGVLPSGLRAGYDFVALTTNKAGRLDKTEELIWDGIESEPAVQERTITPHDVYDDIRDMVLTDLNLEPGVDDARIALVDADIAAMRGR